jgi:hypothetical protein
VRARERARKSARVRARRARLLYVTAAVRFAALPEPTDDEPTDTFAK